VFDDVCCVSLASFLVRNWCGGETLRRGGSLTGWPSLLVSTNKKSSFDRVKQNDIKPCSDHVEIDLLLRLPSKI
jgi:hypothetical protein